MATPKKSKPRCRRVLLTLGDEVDQLFLEAQSKGLRLSTYLRSLVITHQERARGAKVK